MRAMSAAISISARSRSGKPSLLAGSTSFRRNRLPPADTRKRSMLMRLADLRAIGPLFSYSHVKVEVSTRVRKLRWAAQRTSRQQGIHRLDVDQGSAGHPPLLILHAHVLFVPSGRPG